MADYDRRTLQVMPERARKHEIERVTGRLRQALDHMVWDKLTYQEAAAKAELHIRTMRIALSRPQVQAYLRSAKQELLHCFKLRALQRLSDIMETDDQMPAVQAAKALLQHEDDNRQTKQTTPGVVIQIVGDTKQTINASVIPNKTESD